MKQEITELKNKHSDQLNKLSEEIRDHCSRYGPDPCDWLIYRKDMVSYHRGAYNALIELEGLLL